MYKYEVELANLPDGNYRLINEEVYNIGDSQIIIPKDFITDGASIPVLFRWIGTPFESPQVRAVVCHDYMVRVGKCTKKNTKSYRITRKEADRLFLILLLTCGTGISKSYLYYIGVTIGRAFNRVRNRIKILLKQKK